MDLVTPDLGLLFWTGIVFCSLLFLLAKFAWKPILTAVNDREKSISDALELAEKTREEMKSLKAENDQILKQAKAERDEILKDAKSTGDIAELLTGNHNIVDQAYWVRINGAEVAAGEARGKPRVKAVTVPDLLRLGQP